ncbi:MAG: ketopantoate reductase C-terminal domain-containing protein [Mobilicoccus sp.]|nr:ketopantoate reductase C-terminal domain-containing protein [Mobilicoccus sp.]
MSRAEGVPLGAEDLARWEDVLAKQPPQGWTSMHQDVVAGRPTEVDIFAGRVVELGERHGIDTPVNRTIGWILRAGTP